MQVVASVAEPLLYIYIFFFYLMLVVASMAELLLYTYK